MKRWIAVLAVFAAVTFTAFSAREEIVDGMLEPHRITDTDAWTVLFLILKDQPGDMFRWSNEFAGVWLSESGLTPSEQAVVFDAARRYWQEAEEVDQQIEAIVHKGRNDKEVDELVKLKRAKLNGVVMELPLPPESMEKLRRFLHEKVKRGAVVTEQSVLRSWLPVLYAQGGMTGAATTYTAIARSGLVVAAKGVATTGGQFGHKAKVTTTIKHQASGRAVTTTSSTGFSVTTTSYLDLCTLTVCDDGVFLGTTTANLFCPYGGNFAPKQSSNQNTVAKYVTLQSVKFTQVTTNTVVATMPRQNGWVYLRAKVRKSTACGATVVPAEGGFNPDQGVTIQASAPEKTIKFPSGSSNAEGFWELKTSPYNLHAGRVDATVSIADSEGCVAVEWLRNTFVDVD